MTVARRPILIGTTVAPIACPHDAAYGEDPRICIHCGGVIEPRPVVLSPMARRVQANKMVGLRVGGERPDGSDGTEADR